VKKLGCICISLHDTSCWHDDVAKILGERTRDGASPPTERSAYSECTENAAACHRNLLI